MRKSIARKRVSKSRASAKPIKAAARKAAGKKAAGKKAADPILARVRGAERRQVGHVALEVGPAGEGRVKRLIYPVGFHWAKDMKAIVGTDLCMHAHVGFLVRGEIHIEYTDGCIVEFKAPQVVAIEPGHDGWVVGQEPVVMIEFDFERDTARRLGMPDAHRH